ncbi:MAG: hypothetical protein ACI91O_000543 [Candidatus Poriferisodalaceae bacterium]|jgi:hypothetical protein
MLVEQAKIKQPPSAWLARVIDSSTPDAVRALLEDHPQVTTIVLGFVPGSADDEANLEAALLIRDAGLATHVPADGQVASGGADFYWFTLEAAPAESIHWMTSIELDRYGIATE